MSVSVLVVEDHPLVATGLQLALQARDWQVATTSGPTVEADEDDSWLPSERPRGVLGGSGGGTCRPRGGMRGIGVAGRIPVGPPARRLR